MQQFYLELAESINLQPNVEGGGGVHLEPPAKMIVQVTKHQWIMQLY